jgi:hypothetical protein
MAKSFQLVLAAIALVFIANVVFDVMDNITPRTARQRFFLLFLFAGWLIAIRYHD